MASTVKRKASAWLGYAARAGYFVKGFLYATIAMLALQLVFTSSGALEGTTGAIAYIGQQTFGRGLLVVIGFGLVGYSLWRLAQAFFNPDDYGKNVRGYIKRVVKFGSGVVYGGLAASLAYSLATGGAGAGGSDGESKKMLAGWILSFEHGAILLGLLGVGVMVYGAARILGAHNASYMKHMKTHEMSSKQKRFAHMVSKVGISVRGVIFWIMGGFVIWAAYTSDPDNVRGLDGALLAVARQSFGNVLLAAIAIGLLAYTGYCMVAGRWRRIGSTAGR